MEIPARPKIPELRFYAELIKPNSRPGQHRLSADQTAEQLLAGLDYHGITLLALENGVLDSEIIDLIGSRKAMMIAAEALKKNALAELFEAFNSAGLHSTVLFKGTALAYWLYPQPWLRPRTDSDCLVDEKYLDAYQTVFTKLGYQKLFAIEGQYVSYQSTFSKALSTHSAINIDLHRRINNRQILANTYDVDELHESGYRLKSFNSNIVVPNAVDSILISSLHRLGHHPREERLTWLNDINYLLATLDDSDWQKLLLKAADKQLAAICLDALELCQELFGTRLPTSAMVELTGLAEQNEPSKIFLNRDLPEWRYFWQELVALPSLIDRCRLLIENLLPRPSYIRQQMHTRSAVIGYLKRFWRGLKRITASNS